MQDPCLAGRVTMSARGPKISGEEVRRLAGALDRDTQVWNTGLEALTAAESAELDRLRPRTRGACAGGQRPCPWVLCRYHLYGEAYKGDFSPRFPDLEVWELDHTCALDVADLGWCTLEEIGRYMGLTRERVRQIQADALARAGDLFDRGKMEEYLEDL